MKVRTRRMMGEGGLKVVLTCRTTIREFIHADHHPGAGFIARLSVHYYQIPIVCPDIPLTWVT